jgi:hypothetical protein
MRTIRVFYSCPLCGLKNEPANVPARESPDEPVLKWMENTTAILARHHSRRNPACQASGLKNLIIPVSSDGPDVWVGKYTPPGKCPSDELVEEAVGELAKSRKLYKSLPPAMPGDLRVSGGGGGG